MDQPRPVHVQLVWVELIQLQLELLVLKYQRARLLSVQPLQVIPLALRPVHLLLALQVVLRKSLGLNTLLNLTDKILLTSGVTQDTHQRIME